MNEKRVDIVRRVIEKKERGRNGGRERGRDGGEEGKREGE